MDSIEKIIIAFFIFMTFALLIIISYFRYLMSIEYPDSPSVRKIEATEIKDIQNEH